MAAQKHARESHTTVVMGHAGKFFAIVWRGARPMGLQHSCDHPAWTLFVTSNIATVSGGSVGAVQQTASNSDAHNMHDTCMCSIWNPTTQDASHGVDLQNALAVS